MNLKKRTIAAIVGFITLLGVSVGIAAPAQAAPGPNVGAPVVCYYKEYTLFGKKVHNVVLEQKVIAPHWKSCHVIQTQSYIPGNWGKKTIYDGWVSAKF